MPAEESRLLSSKKKKERTICLKCDKPFMSEDRIRIRICPVCKDSKAWKGSQQSDFLLPPSGNVMNIPTYAQAGQKKSRKAPSFRRAIRKRKKA